MSHVPEVSGVQWLQMHYFIQRLYRIRTRNAFSDARRAQTARLLVQQAGPPLGQYSHDAFRFDSRKVADSIDRSTVRPALGERNARSGSVG